MKLQNETFSEPKPDLLLFKSFQIFLMKSSFLRVSFKFTQKNYNQMSQIASNSGNCDCKISIPLMQIRAHKKNSHLITEIFFYFMSSSCRTQFSKLSFQSFLFSSLVFCNKYGKQIRNVCKRKKWK